MGLASDLGYDFRPPNAFRRVMQAFGSTTFGAWFFAKTLRYMDRVVHAVSKGRTSTPMILAGLPVVLVTTTGRKTGEARTSPLLAPPIGDTLALLGTNFGQPHTPGWVVNLEADPRATIEYRNNKVEVRARPASPEEQTEIWKAAAGVYGGYTKYQQRITGRTVRVFVLEPAGGS